MENKDTNTTLKSSYFDNPDATLLSVRLLHMQTDHFFLLGDNETRLHFLDLCYPANYTGSKSDKSLIP